MNVIESPCIRTAPIESKSETVINCLGHGPDSAPLLGADLNALGG